MNPIGTEQNREAFRIDDEAEVYYRLASEEELLNEPCESDDFSSRQSTLSKFAKIDNEYAPILQLLKDQSSEVADYMTVINTKLHLLAAALLPQETGTTASAAQWVNLSERGIAFYTPDTFATGTILKLQLILLPNYNALVTFSRVVKSEIAEASLFYKPETPYLTALEFIVMQPIDRQILTRHIFRRQAEERRRIKPLA